MLIVLSISPGAKKDRRQIGFKHIYCTIKLIPNLHCTVYEDHMSQMSNNTIPICTEVLKAIQQQMYQ